MAPCCPSDRRFAEVAPGRTSQRRRPLQAGNDGEGGAEQRRSAVRGERSVYRAAQARVGALYARDRPSARNSNRRAAIIVSTGHGLDRLAQKHLCRLGRRRPRSFVVENAGTSGEGWVPVGCRLTCTTSCASPIRAASPALTLVIGRIDATGADMQFVSEMAEQRRHLQRRHGEPTSLNSNAGSRRRSVLPNAKEFWSSDCCNGGSRQTRAGDEICVLALGR